MGKVIWTPVKKANILEDINNRISNGDSLNKILNEKGYPSSETFYIWIDADASTAKNYARACTRRQEKIFEETLEIADRQGKDVYKDQQGIEQTNHNVIQRNRLMVDTRKWALGKMNPKKYGEAQLLKLGDHEGEELKVNAIFTYDPLSTDNSADKDSEAKEND